MDIIKTIDGSIFVPDGNIERSPSSGVIVRNLYTLMLHITLKAKLHWFIIQNRLKVVKVILLQ